MATNKGQNQTASSMAHFLLFPFFPFFFFFLLSSLLSFGIFTVPMFTRLCDAKSVVWVCSHMPALTAGLFFLSSRQILLCAPIHKYLYQENTISKIVSVWCVVWKLYRHVIVLDYLVRTQTPCSLLPVSSLKVCYTSSSPKLSHVILCAWLDSKHQLTN